MKILFAFPAAICYLGVNECLLKFQKTTAAAFGYKINKQAAAKIQSHYHAPLRYGISGHWRVTQWENQRNQARKLAAPI